MRFFFIWFLFERAFSIMLQIRHSSYCFQDLKGQMPEIVTFLFIASKKITGVHSLTFLCKPASLPFFPALFRVPAFSSWVPLANYCIKHFRVSSSLMHPHSLEGTLVQISVVDMLPSYHAALSIALYYELSSKHRKWNNDFILLDKVF